MYVPYSGCYPSAPVFYGASRQASKGLGYMDDMDWRLPLLVTWDGQKLPTSWAGLGCASPGGSCGDSELTWQHFLFAALEIFVGVVLASKLSNS